MVKKRKPRTTKAVTSGPDDPLLGSRFQVVISSMVMGATTAHTSVNLTNLLREMRDHHDLALRHVWSCFLIEREDEGNEEGIAATKDVIIEKIATHWGVVVTPKQLEPKTDIEWQELEDLKLPYDAAKLPIVKKAKVEPSTVKPQTSLEDALSSGKYDVE